jgi:hypothetical protein
MGEELHLPACRAGEIGEPTMQYPALEEWESPGPPERRQLSRLAQVVEEPIDARSDRDQRAKVQAQPIEQAQQIPVDRS